MKKILIHKIDSNYYLFFQSYAFSIHADQQDINTFLKTVGKPINNLIVWAHL